jgi:hypothetical protein
VVRPDGALKRRQLASNQLPAKRAAGPTPGRWTEHRGNCIDGCCLTETVRDIQPHRNVLAYIALLTFMFIGPASSPFRLAFRAESCLALERNLRAAVKVTHYTNG